MDPLMYLLLIGSIFFIRYYFSKGKTLERKFEQFDTRQTINEVNGQLVKIVGFVQPKKEYLISPISGKSCVFYDVKVEMFSHEGSNGLRLDNVITERNAMEIIVKNEARNLFSVQLADSNLEFVSKYRTVNISNWLYELVESEKAFLQKYNIAQDYAKYIFTETIIQDTDEIEVIGAISQSDNADIPYNIGLANGELLVNVVERFRS